MQNLPQKSIDLLSHINQEIGIDITKYENDDIMGQVTGLLMIQNYALSSLYKPLMLSFGSFILGFFTLSLELLGYIVYGFLGFILFALIGFFFGIIKMLSSLKKDLHSITNFALDTTKFMLADLNHLNNTLRNDIKNPIGLVFEGAIAAFVTPYISKQCNRIPLAGNIMISGSDKVLNTVVRNFKKKEDNFDIKNRIEGTSHGVTDKAAMVENFIISFSTNVDRLLNRGFKTVQLPFRIALFCVISCTFILMLSVSIF